MSLFEDIAASWRPEDHESVEVVGAEGPAFFSALLDQPTPMVEVGDPLPRLWHWFMFLPIYPQADIGADGHPLDAAFTPPIPNRRRMFGGGRLSVTAPLRLGDEVVKRSSATSIKVKEGGSGPLLLVTVTSEFSVSGSVRIVEEQDIVYLQATPTSGKPPEPPSGAVPPEAQWRLSLQPDPPLLFRFSALTRNAHRTHYDRDLCDRRRGPPRSGGARPAARNVNAGTAPSFCIESDPEVVVLALESTHLRPPAHRGVR